MPDLNSAKVIFILILLTINNDCFQAEKIILSIYGKKPMAITDERFLSLTLDSNVIFNGALFK